MPYRISSHGYLARAQAQLADGRDKTLFYAAFELRCGIEARMREYLEAWEHVSKRKKSGWRIADLGRNVEETFRLGDRIVRLAAHNLETGALTICFYHTPVSATLQKQAERLGDALHSMKKYRPPSDSWWSKLRQELKDTADQLRIATTGTLLGPPMTKDGLSTVDVKLEIPPNTDPQSALGYPGGVKLGFQVSYHTALPDPIEKEAMVWHRVG